MVGRRPRARPHLALLGTGPVAAQVEVAAAQLRWTVAPIEVADLVYVDRHARFEDVAELARVAASVDSGPHLAVDLGWIVDHGAPAFDRLDELAPGRIRRGEPLTAAPAVQEWVRRVGSLGEIGHLSGRCTQVELTPALVVLVLFAATHAGAGRRLTIRPGHDEGEGHPGRRTVHVDGADGTAVATIVGGDRDPPEFELQAAAPHTVDRMVLLPDPRLERNGVDEVLPAARPTVAFGHEPFLQAWWEAVRRGRPATHDRPFVTALVQAMDGLRV